MLTLKRFLIYLSRAFQKTKFVSLILKFMKYTATKGGGYVDVTTNLLRTKFDIKKIVESFQFEYCLVKIQKEFPNLYAVALDVDMFCGNTTEAKEELKKIVAQTTDFEYKIKDNFSPYNQGTLVFLYREGNEVFDTAFDLINSYYYRKRDTENFTFSKTLFDDCLKSRELKNINGCKCYVPSEKYDLLIRYMELLKHPDNESKQIKHRSYLKERLAPDQIEEFHKLIDEYVKYDGEYLI